MKKIHLLILLSFTFLAVQAQKKQSVENPEVYIFGVGTSFNDSTTYISEIHHFKGNFIEKKTGFLENRAIYAEQMKIYLEQNYPGYETCAIFYDTKKKAIEKKYNKVRRRYQKDKSTKLVELPVTEFTFNPVKSKQ